MTRFTTLLRLAVVLASATGACEQAVAQAESCSLSGQWRSSIGVLTILQTETADGAAIGAAFKQGATIVRIDGTFSENTLDARFQGPSTKSGPAPAGLLSARVSDDCTSLLGSIRPVDGADRPLKAVRIAQSKAPPISPSRAAFASTQLDLLARGLESYVDATTDFTFRPKELAESLNRDPEKILVWVRDNTKAAPYEGLLRGAEGVWDDRVGSRLDRAVFLARLMAEAGQEVRLASAARVEEEPGDAVVSRRPTQEWLPKIATGTLLDVAKLPGFDRQPYARYVADEADSAVDLALDAEDIASAGDALVTLAIPVRVESSQPKKPTLDWWVERQSGEEWLPMRLDPGPVPASSSRMAFEDVPAGQIHTVEVSVGVEFDREGGPQSSTVLTHVFPAAAYAGKDVTLAFVPASVTLPSSTAEVIDGVQGLLAGVRQESVWAPILLVDDTILSEKQFDIDGTVAPLDVDALASGSPAGAAKATGGLFGNIADQLEGGGASRDLLVAVYVDITVHAPGQTDRTERRWIVRKRSANESHEVFAARRMDAMLGDCRIRISVADRAPPLVMHDGAAAAAADLRIEAKTLSAAALGSIRTEPTSSSSGVLELVANEVVRFLLRDDRVFADGPQVTVIWRLVDRRSLFEETTVLDIVFHSVGVWTSDPREAFDLRVRSGLADTFAEGLVATDTNTSAGLSLLLDSADLQIFQAAADMTDRLPISNESRALVASDLARGYAIVVPTGRPQGDIWWRVDPRSGETLGFISDGFGGATLEYGALTIERAKVIVRVASLARCIQSGVNSKKNIKVAAAFVCALGQLLSASSQLLKLRVLKLNKLLELSKKLLPIAGQAQAPIQTAMFGYSLKDLGYISTIVGDGSSIIGWSFAIAVETYPER